MLFACKLGLDTSLQEYTAYITCVVKAFIEFLNDHDLHKKFDVHGLCYSVCTSFGH